MINGASLRYNEVHQKSVHNAFQRNEGIPDQILYWGVRSLELDIHADGGDWRVLHFPVLDPGTTVERLSTALDLLRGAQTALSEHEIITVFLDLKTDFDGACTPDGLDQLIRSRREGRLFTPRDLLHLHGANTLQEAAAAGWPRLGELRGRLLFVLTGGGIDAEEAPLNLYVSGGDRAETRVCFVAPSITRRRQITSAHYAVFFNLKDANRNWWFLGQRIHDAGFIGRSYYVNRRDAWDRATERSLHHLATDKVNEETTQWASTRNARGWPFQRIVGDQPRGSGPETLGIRVQSGDLWDQRDSFYFCYRRSHPDEANRTYSTFIAISGSGTHEWAKATLLARASLAADAAYLGVVRPARHGVRIQFRPRSGAKTQVIERPIADGVDPHTILLVKLQLLRHGREARGFASLTGLPGDWIEIGRATFREPLLVHGFAASSHDPCEPATFLLGSLHGELIPPFRTGRQIGDTDGASRHFRGSAW